MNKYHFFKCNLMNKSIFEKICFDTLYNKLPNELIYEIVDKVPTCCRCKLFPKTRMDKCFICQKNVCDKCLKDCNDCLDKVCIQCSNDLYNKFFDIHTICDSCYDSPKCATCHDIYHYNIERCIECYKPVCGICNLTCCSDTIVICQDCVEQSDEMYSCDCQGNVICSNCSYPCKYCERRMCGECKDLSVAYTGKKLCLECRQD